MKELELDLIDDIEDDLNDDLGDDTEEPDLLENNVDFTAELQDTFSTNLCDVIITFRYLGVFKARAIACMKELAQRRANGDTFEFEEYIQTQMKTMPNINAAIPKYSLPLSGLFKK